MRGKHESLIAPPVESPIHAVNALKCELASEVLLSSGTLRLRVTGWSMLPCVMPGDTLTVDRASADDVSVGDIVLFSRDRRLFAHRVISRNQPPGNGIVTRGDAMPTPDPPVLHAEVLGRVSLIVRNGKRIDARRGPRFSQTAVGAVLRRSIFAARVVVGLQEVRQAFWNRPAL